MESKMKNKAIITAIIKPDAIVAKTSVTLSIAFSTIEDAKKAFEQHICLCRNEDILLPVNLIETTKSIFESDERLFNGFELVFEKAEKSFLVGYNRFTSEQMYGWIRVVGNPITQY